MREEDYDTWDRLIVKAKKVELPADMLITARGRRDTTAVRRHLEALPGDPRSVTFTTRYLWIYYGDGELAEQVGMIGTQFGAPPARALTNLALAELDVARGRWDSAQRRLRSTPAPPPFEAQTFRRVAATLPFMTLPREQLLAARNELQSWNGSAPAGTDPTRAAMMPHARLYMMGLLDARLGDDKNAELNARALEQIADPTGQPAVRRDLALIIRAQLAALRGDHAKVITLLEPVRGQIPLPLIRRKEVVPSDYIFAQDHARFLRATALRELGRHDEALQWLTLSFMGAPAELVYRAPLHYEMAQTYERMGDRAQARRYYASFIDAWEAADPSLQPFVNAARTRLSSLSSVR